MPKIVDHEARREEISAIAAKLIAKGGLEATTIREIALNSGYSKGVIEHYFLNKEEIISGALAWANQCFQSRVAKSTEGLSGLAALEKRLESTLPLSRAVLDEWKVRLVFWGMAAIKSDLRKQQEARFTRAVSLFEADIIDAIAVGELNDSVDVPQQARHIVNMVSGISTAALHSKKLYSKAFLLAEMKCLIDSLRNS